MFYKQLLKFSFSELLVGKVYSLERVFRYEDVKAYATLIGDFNPIHLDQEEAEKSIFGKRVAHGMLSASLFSTLVGTNFPGAIYLDQSIHFKAPIYYDELIKASVEIKEIKITKGRKKINLITQVRKMGPEIKIAVDGEAFILLY